MTLPLKMTVVALPSFGNPEEMRLSSRPVPVCAENEVLIKVAAAGVNRADLLQRRGNYPPPAGASDIMGLEVSGTIAALGINTGRWNIGDHVCALLAGGGYAEYVAVPETHCLPTPLGLTPTEAAALPEAVATVYANVFESAALQPHETALIHGGSSGIGTTAIQMIKTLGARVITTAGSPEKAAACSKLGADLTIEYKTEDFVAATLAATNGHGVDVVLDMVGGDYLDRNLQALAFQGRHVSIATQSNALAEIDLRQVMQKRLIITGSTLRNRDSAEKARLIGKIEEIIWPYIAAGTVKPVIYQSFSLNNVVEAHKMMESGAHIGKIVLEVS